LFIPVVVIAPRFLSQGTVARSIQDHAAARHAGDQSLAAKKEGDVWVVTWSIRIV